MKLFGKILQIIGFSISVFTYVSQILKATLHDIDASIHACGEKMTKNTPLGFSQTQLH
jgi:hypothetical protein